MTGAGEALRVIEMVIKLYNQHKLARKKCQQLGITILRLKELLDGDDDEGFLRTKVCERVLLRLGELEVALQTRTENCCFFHRLFVSSRMSTILRASEDLHFQLLAGAFVNGNVAAKTGAETLKLVQKMSTKLESFAPCHCSNTSSTVRSSNSEWNPRLPIDQLVKDVAELVIKKVQPDSEMIVEFVVGIGAIGGNLQQSSSQSVELASKSTWDKSVLVDIEDKLRREGFLSFDVFTAYETGEEANQAVQKIYENASLVSRCDVVRGELVNSNTANPTALFIATRQTPCQKISCKWYPLQQVRYVQLASGSIRFLTNFLFTKDMVRLLELSEKVRAKNASDVDVEALVSLKAAYKELCWCEDFRNGVKLNSSPFNKMRLLK